jgi:hemerythrin
MAYFPWRAEYQVNIALIDTQHKQLVELLNQLYDAMRAGKGKDATGRVLNELVEYTKLHFATEERLMEEHAYPGFLAHLAKHTHLTSKVIEYQQAYIKGGSISVELSMFLKDWLISHIQGVDMKYSPYLIAKGVK